MWMRDSRIPASVVANFRIAACNFRSRFGPARRAQNETAWRASYYFPLEKYIGNTTGTRAWKGSRVRQAVRIWDRFWSTLAPPFLPLSLRIPAPHTPPPLPDRYSSTRRPRPRLRSPPSSPRRYSLTFHTPQHTFYPPAPPPTTEPPCITLLFPFMFICNHIILRTHPCLYISPKNISLSRYLSRPLRDHNSVMVPTPPRSPRRQAAPKLRCRHQSTRGNARYVHLTLYRK